MSRDPRICLFGQFIVDVTLPTSENPYKLRAGGIMHAARALWALDIPYSIAYCAPEYLTSQAQQNAEEYSAESAIQFGVVTGCPNVVIVAEPKETGHQGYEFLLRDMYECREQIDVVEEHFSDAVYSDVLLFPGGFDVTAVLEVLRPLDVNVFADANFAPDDLELFRKLGRPLEAVIYSTSSRIFLDRFSGDLGEMKRQLLSTSLSNSVLLKENRGGSRFLRGDDLISVPAQQRTIQHSVGVGDCFNAAFVALRHRYSEHAALAYASCIAAEYACTTFPDDFKKSVQAWLAVEPDEIEQLAGIVLPWEDRKQINVYIAAPDFDDVDTGPVDRIADSLTYHNFTPRLPVRENGQMGRDASTERRQMLCDADIALLDECQLMVAVLLFNDPGTLIEIGIAVERKMPVFVYDPFSIADNLMLTQLPFCVSPNLDEVISALFSHASKL